MNSGISYLLNRKVSEEVINTFDLGFCDSKKELLMPKHLDSVWYNYLTDKDRHIYNNLIFPVSVVPENVVGMVFRNINKKAFFSNKGFEKTNYLYGIHNAFEDIYKKKFVIIVEGLLDVLVGHSYGFKNVISVFGNRISYNQACFIKRLCDKVLIIGDGDLGGKILINRGGKVLKEIGVSVRSMYEDKKDPDDLFILGKHDFNKL